MLLDRIADRLILQPTRHPVSPGGKRRHAIPAPNGGIEIWTERIGTESLDDADIFVLKFCGTGGRAEQTNLQPLTSWHDLKGEVWSVNPPGYGGSSGRASLQGLATTGMVVYEKIREVAAGRPVIVTGNSLGTVVALYLGARVPVQGLILRNPPPLRQLIVGRHGWWNLWVGAMLVSSQVPQSLCSIENAQRCQQVPAVFIGSVRDQIVPATYQVRVVRAYAGPKKILRLRNANHSTSMSGQELVKYADRLRWLRGQIPLVGG